MQMCTIFPRSDAAPTIFVSPLKLAAIIRGRRLNEGGNKNFHSIITVCIYSASSTAFSLHVNASSYSVRPSAPG